MNGSLLFSYTATGLEMYFQSQRKTQRHCVLKRHSSAMSRMSPSHRAKLNTTQYSLVCSCSKSKVGTVKSKEPDSQILCYVRRNFDSCSLEFCFSVTRQSRLICPPGNANAHVKYAHMQNDSHQSTLHTSLHRVCRHKGSQEMVWTFVKYYGFKSLIYSKPLMCRIMQALSARACKLFLNLEPCGTVAELRPSYLRATPASKLAFIRYCAQPLSVMWCWYASIPKPSQVARMTQAKAAAAGKRAWYHFKIWAAVKDMPEVGFPQSSRTQGGLQA